jgi:glycosyltransferase involved in cell wall biosynthesis
MKILELTNYSAGICGVWQRVKQESSLLSKKHEVKIFSSNITKGSEEIAQEKELLGNINIQRFPAKKLGGESFMNWNFEKQALDYQPDIILAHSYRHSHTKKALKIAQKLKKQGKSCKVFLITHAPFERSSSRSIISNSIVRFYDLFIGKNIINKFDKVLAITKWEIPHLIRLGCKKQNIQYMPNGIPNQLFKQKKSKEQKNKILFLGRIAPIKDLETLISAIDLIKNKKYALEIVGPAKEDYLIKLKKLIKSKNLTKKVIFSPPIYDLKQKIKKIDSCNVFVLPSKSEGMPQSLIEAMAREKIVIASNTSASRDLIKDNKNGFLFKICASNQLAEKIELAFSTDQNKLKKQAKKAVENFNWNKIINKLESLF